MNTIRPQQNGEPARERRSPDAFAHQITTGDTEPVVENVGVVGGRMSGKERAVNTGDPCQRETREEVPCGSQSHHSSDEAGNDRGAKGGRKENLKK
jgi:hypothetical protein